MYNQSQLQDVNSDKDIKLSPLLPALNEELNAIYEKQEKLISLVEEKLHSIKNNRQPTKGESMNDQIAPVSDFYSQVYESVQKIKRNTYRLDNIVSHLSQIV